MLVRPSLQVSQEEAHCFAADLQQNAEGMSQPAESHLPRQSSAFFSQDLSSMQMLLEGKAEVQLPAAPRMAAIAAFSQELTSW